MCIRDSVWAALMAAALVDAIQGVFVGLAAAVCSLAVQDVYKRQILWCVALRFGHNASVGMGTLGFIAALTLMGGLANGLVTGTFSGAFSICLLYTSRCV